MICYLFWNIECALPTQMEHDARLAGKSKAALKEAAGKETQATCGDSPRRCHACSSGGQQKRSHSPRVMCGLLPQSGEG